jgi:E-phenylitaconyl-CoA hydratase
LNTLRLAIADGIAEVVLDRPDKRNAISDEMRAELAEVFAGLASNEAVRCVILTGAGTVFCAGVDLGSANASTDPAERPRVSAPLDRFEKPVIAALNGAAVGGGLELALAADIRLATRGARFSLPEVRIGSLPGSGGTQRLARVVGLGRATEMLLTGTPIDAETALTIGLVTRLCEDEQLIAAARELARTIAGNAPLSIRAAKKALARSLDVELEDGLRYERELFLALARSEDRQEGRAAFREKRTPNFRGR